MVYTYTDYYELQSGGGLIGCRLEGALDSNDPQGITPLYISQVGPPKPLSVPLAPGVITGSMPSRDSAIVTWTAPDNTGRPPLTDYRIFRSEDGSTPALVHTMGGTSTLTWTDTGLPTHTSPEIVFEYTVCAVNADGPGAFSNVLSLQWAGPVLLAPTAPITLTRSGLGTDKVTLNWTEAVEAGIIDHQIWINGVLFRSGLDPAATSYAWTGLTPGTTYANVTIRRTNAQGLSPHSPSVTFTTLASSVTLPLIGISVPDSGRATTFSPEYGGFTQWDVVRIYDFNDVTRAMTFNPKVIALTNSTSAIQDLANSPGELAAFLDDFYNTTGTAYGKSLAVRRATRIDYANGNEYAKDVDNITQFQNTCKAMYAEVHKETTPGVRDYPNANFGLDPTHDQELSGTGGIFPAQSMAGIEEYLDFIAWSMYPPGRKQTESNPRYDIPSENGAQTPQGFMERCFARTDAVRTIARNRLNDQSHQIDIVTWEIGIGDQPADSTRRPWYIARTLIPFAYERAKDYNLPFPYFLWWNQQTNKSGVLGPENVLSDEPSTTDPSSAEALRNWYSYNPQYPGGALPASWVGKTFPTY